ncbi:hypothetical protein HYI36_22900 [Bacillus sp. Gen3]|nr:hypothetical protein [Bacillus sp. Gen3]
MPKPIRQKAIEVEGIEYVLRHPGLMKVVEMKDRIVNENGNADEVFYRELMEHVIFLKDGSKVDFEFFEENPGFLEVMSEAKAFTFEQPKSNRYYRQRAKERGLMWRLVLEKIIDYETVLEMTLDEIFEANAALDIHIENANKANKKGGRK